MALRPIMSANESTWIQNCIDYTLRAWGAENHNVNLVLIIGSNLGIPTGQVHINWGIFSFFSYEEVRFIISHECAHIFENHNLARALFAAIEDALPIITNNPISTDFIKVISSTVNLIITGHFRDISGEILANNELQADRMAARYTGTSVHGINSIRKLARNNLNSFSHFWDLVGYKVGALTAHERINNLLALGF